MTPKLQPILDELAPNARKAKREMRSVSTQSKNDALKKAAQFIRDRQQDILAVNAADITAAQDKGMTDAFVDRLTLNEERLIGICEALHEIAALEDPVGKVISETTRPNGLVISRVRTPIGVVAMIYESRPNVTVDAAAIALKAGNAVILRGGSECIDTNKVLFKCIYEGAMSAGLPEGAVQFVDTTDRSVVGAILSGLDGTIDLVIPRGGKSLVARVQSDARVPVLSHLDGICHVYIDRDADLEKAVQITVNSKMRRTGVCGAAETLLIDSARLSDILPSIVGALREQGCTLRGDSAVCAAAAEVTQASEDDWYTEYLAPILSIASVEGVEGAIAHIEKYSSGHTESIVTQNQKTADRFLTAIDSAIVLHNASTQFADGGEFGLGAEIGIATGRLHARGPVGVEELTTYKNIVRGEGQIRP